MNTCPECGSKSKCVDSREREGSQTLRRYRCPNQHRYSTIECVAEVRKKDAADATPKARKVREITIDGLSLPIAGWAELMGVSNATARSRLLWARTLKDIETPPKRGRKRMQMVEAQE